VALFDEFCEEGPVESLVEFGKVWLLQDHFDGSFRDILLEQLQLSLVLSEVCAVE
jgi:hypothetical protein